MKVYTFKNVNKEDISTKECKFALEMSHIKEKDLTMYKEKLVLNNGEVVKRVVVLEDFLKPIWVTKPNLRNHSEKKEYELKGNCIEYMTTRTQEMNTLSRALKIPLSKFSKPWNIYKNQYVYGTDIKHSEYLKYQYNKKGGIFSTSEMAVFDTETSVLDDKQEIVIATLTFKNKAICCVVKDFVKRYDLRTVNTLIRERYKKYLVDSGLITYKVDLEIVLVDDPALAVIECFRRAHEWKPDFVAMWNMNFDMNKSAEILTKYGHEPKHIFSDPDLPKEWHYYNFVKGPTVKRKENGDVMPLIPAKQWDYVECPASFLFVDAMQVFDKIRAGVMEKFRSYSLDYILNHELGIRKLNFAEADHIKSKLHWHKFMQKHYPLEYIIYNIFDCQSIELLDQRTKDIQLTLLKKLGINDFKDFSSSPNITWGEAYTYLLENNKVQCSSRGFETDFDKRLIPPLDIIVTLPAPLVTEKSSKFFLEEENWTSRVHTHVGDIDIGSAYPTNNETLNISRETTVNELLDAYNDFEPIVLRTQGLNLSGGKVNALEFCNQIFNMPNLMELDKLFKQHLKNQF